MGGVIGVVIAIIFVIAIIIYGGSAVGDVYKVAGCSGVILAVVIIWLLAAFGL